MPEWLNNISGILLVVFFFGFSVFIHEFGHLLAAVWRGLHVEKFSIGFGPAILKYQDKSKTIWQLSAIPLGGYVKFAGEMYANDKTDRKIKNGNRFCNTFLR